MRQNDLQINLVNLFPFDIFKFMSYCLLIYPLGLLGPQIVLYSDSFFALPKREIAIQTFVLSGSLEERLRANSYLYSFDNFLLADNFIKE